MAFVRRSEKTLLQAEVTGAGALGPGAYEVKSSIHVSKRPNAVPFATSAVRSTANSVNFTANPGPGEYTRHVVQYADKHSATSSMFLSSASRFQDLQPSQQAVPGPGSYHKPSNWVREKKHGGPRVAGTSVPQAENPWTRLSNPPSIPSKTQSYGYAQSRSGDLQLRKAPQAGYSGLPSDCPGPGSYARPNTEWFSNSHRGVNFHASRVHREGTKHTKAKSAKRDARSLATVSGGVVGTPGPGSYINPDAHSAFPARPASAGSAQQSAAAVPAAEFSAQHLLSMISGSAGRRPGGSGQTIGVKPGHVPRGMLRPSSIFAPRKGTGKGVYAHEQATDVQKAGCTDPTVGPGSYDLTAGGTRTCFSRAARQDVQPKFQGFGSRAARGLSHIKSSSHVDDVGPGSYNIHKRGEFSTAGVGGGAGAVVESYQRLAVARKARRFGAARSSSVFASRVHRFNRLREKQQDTTESPGPGTYSKLCNYRADLSRKSFGRNCTFGTTSARFPKKKSRSANDQNRRGAVLGGPLGALGFSATADLGYHSRKRYSVPGPGSYRPDKVVSIANDAERVRYRPAAVFRSGVRRFKDGSGVHPQRTPFTPLLGQQPAAPPEPSPVRSSFQTKDASRQSSMFSSKTARGLSSASTAKPSSGDTSSALASHVGPGSYDIRTRLGDPTPSDAVPRSSTFRSSTVRFGGAGGGSHVQSAMESDTPGPGSYIDPLKSDLIKPSFNISI